MRPAAGRPHAPTRAAARARPPERRPTSEQLLATWTRYRETGDRVLRDRLVLSLAPLVKHLAYRKVRDIPAHVEVDTFISVGLEALLLSLDRYDPEKGASLEQYVWTRVHGALLDEMRRQDWAPRSVRRFERAATKAAREFQAIHGREPSEGEMADLLGLDPAALNRHRIDLQRSDVGSLHEPVASEEPGTVERLDVVPSHDLSADPEHVASMADARARFRQAFAELDERDRTVAVLLYVEELTLNEIGEVLGVSESRVSQLHTQLRRRLRDRLGAEFAQLLAA